jgi:hypothetical protein
VYQPAKLSPEKLKQGYDWAYREFYTWSSILRGSLSHGTLKHQAKHFCYAAGWKKFEPLWDLVIRARQLRIMTPVLEGVLSKVTAEIPGQQPAPGGGSGTGSPKTAQFLPIAQATKLVPD